MEKITIYTDGSSKGNPGPGGWAALVIFSSGVSRRETTINMDFANAKSDKKNLIVSGGEPSTTNNRMEILAVIKGLELARKKFGKKVAVTVISDSSLVIKTMNEGWKTKKNVDLWEALGRAADGLKIKWEWVKGHAHDKYNNECDRLAQKEADKLIGSETHIASDDGDGFHCEKCGKTTEGILSQKTSNSPIRVDCANCGKYIKFAPKTKENLARVAKKQESLF